MVESPVHTYVSTRGDVYRRTSGTSGASFKRNAVDMGLSALKAIIGKKSGLILRQYCLPYALKIGTISAVVKPVD